MLGFGLIVGCSDDDDPIIIEDPEEEETITRVSLTFTPDNGEDAVSATWFDAGSVLAFGGRQDDHLAQPAGTGRRTAAVDLDDDTATTAERARRPRLRFRHSGVVPGHGRPRSVSGARRGLRIPLRHAAWAGRSGSVARTRRAVRYRLARHPAA